MKKTAVSFFILIIIVSNVHSQGKKSKEDAYEFKITHNIKTTPVKDQGKTGTCWSFATTSFIETELIRMGKGEHILSTMYNVRFAYPQKAKRYVRYSGNAAFGMGGQAHDVFNVIKEYGIVPEEIYPAMNIKEEKHNHGELDAVIKAITDAVIRNKGGKITPVWPKVIDATLDVYLGIPPKEFFYKGIKYSPKSFVDSLGFNVNDYVEFTSFTHHPFYKWIDLEVPDNWSRDKYYNIPIDVMMHMIDSSLIAGYSVLWDGDTSEKDFSKKGIAIVPQEEAPEVEDDEDKNKKYEPVKEKFITQEMRQETFDNQTTTDDHLMHITGLAKDKRGYTFYYTKNSWGTKDKKFEGYWYISEPYLRLKTIAVVLHKDAIPDWLKKKINIY
jgi:bleomycin hydrolase